MAKTTIKYNRFNPNWRLGVRIKRKGKPLTRLKILAGKKRKEEKWDTRKSISET